MLVGMLAGYLATVMAEKTSKALVPKALEPKPHRVDASFQSAD
jgi:hypothetical protein